MPANKYNDSSVDSSGAIINWDNPASLVLHRKYELNDGWVWSGDKNSEGLLWGGCVEAVDEMLRYGVEIPGLEQFEKIVLLLETSEEIPSADYVRRVVRALGERGILERVQGICVGRPKAWENLIRKKWLKKSRFIERYSKKSYSRLCVNIIKLSQ